MELATLQKRSAELEVWAWSRQLASPCEQSAVTLLRAEVVAAIASGAVLAAEAKASASALTLREAANGFERSLAEHASLAQRALAAQLSTTLASAEQERAQATSLAASETVRCAALSAALAAASLEASAAQQALQVLRTELSSVRQDAASASALARAAGSPLPPAAKAKAPRKRKAGAVGVVPEQEKAAPAVKVGSVKRLRKAAPALDDSAELSPIAPVERPHKVRGGRAVVEDDAEPAVVPAPPPAPAPAPVLPPAPAFRAGRLSLQAEAPPAARPLSSLPVGNLGLPFAKPGTSLSERGFVMPKMKPRS